MFENRLPDVRRRKLLLGACCAFVAFIGLQRFFGSLSVFPAVIGGLENQLLDSNPGHTLRVIQSIGILLPLFAGLLRFTTNDQSDVNEQVNDYLLLGILGLVLAGAIAAFAGMVTDVAGILKISLFFILLTFTVIGFAAIDMLSRIAESENGADSQKIEAIAGLEAESRDDKQETNPSSATASGEADEREENETESETQAGADSEVSSQDTERTMEKTDTIEPDPSKSTNN